MRTRQQIYALDRKHNVIEVVHHSNRNRPPEPGVLVRDSATARRSPTSSDDRSAGDPPTSHQSGWSTGSRPTERSWIGSSFRCKPDRARTNEATSSLLFALALPAPAILLRDRAVIPDGGRSGAELSGGVQCHRSNGYGLRSWPSCALASVLAVIAWRRSRAFGLRRREQIAWTVFVLLFGFPAYVGFLLYRRWPIREPCPNCHAQAPRDRAACAECGTRFPDPALKGIEIFA